jgi:predicted ATPase
VEDGEVVESSLDILPPASKDRLYLVAAAGLQQFRPLYDALSHMGFYNLNPDAIRELQPPDPGEVLKRDGSNLASVLSLMVRKNPDSHSRVVSFLGSMVAGITNVDVKHIGRKETLEFRQKIGTNQNPWRFGPENMSDGTLRALGVLTALFQAENAKRAKVPFVGIEEPEAAVHPGAAGILRDALLIASQKAQVAVTSHSPDLLDDKDIPETSILAVENRNGETVIGPLDFAGRSSIRDRLYTAGELLRLNQLEPAEAAAESASTTTSDLFADYLP